MSLNSFKSFKIPHIIEKPLFLFKNLQKESKSLKKALKHVKKASISLKINLKCHVM
jgi:hypothetical protein